MVGGRRGIRADGGGDSTLFPHGRRRHGRAGDVDVGGLGAAGHRGDQAQLVAVVRVVELAHGRHWVGTITGGVFARLRSRYDARTRTSNSTPVTASVRPM